MPSVRDVCRKRLPTPMGPGHQRFDGDDGTRPFRGSRRISKEFEHFLGLSVDLYDVAELRHGVKLPATPFF